MAKKEYIEREKALGAICEYCASKGDEPCSCAERELMLSIPAADVEEVKHGRWIKRGQDIFCSECGGESKYTWHGSSSFSNYCPDCGAKMNGGKDETK